MPEKWQAKICERRGRDIVDEFLRHRFEDEAENMDVAGAGPGADEDINHRTGGERRGQDIPDGYRRRHGDGAAGQ